MNIALQRKFIYILLEKNILQNLSKNFDKIYQKKFFLIKKNI